MSFRSASVLALALLAAPLAAQERELGWLSARYESNGNPATVSGGVGDAGGVSYGSYQMTSQTKQKSGKVVVGGTVKNFVAAKYPDDFKGLTPGTPAFSAKWKEVAIRDSAAFASAQHQYIKETHYDKTAAGVNALGLDLGKRSSALDNVIWSTSVQHGPGGGTSIVRAALAKQIKDGTVGQMTDEDIIKAIYAERGRKKANGTLAHFSGNSKAVQAGVAARFVREQADALAALAAEKKEPPTKPTPTPKPTPPTPPIQPMKPMPAPTPPIKPTPPTPSSSSEMEEYYEILIDGRKATEAPTAEKAASLVADYTLVYKKPATSRGPFTRPKAKSADPLKVDAGQVTFDAEGNDDPKSIYYSRRLHWPKGGSGATIGRGYDMKERSKASIIADLTAAGLSPADAKKYAEGAGLQGAAAEKFVADNKGVLPELTREQQKKLFDITYAQTKKDIARVLNKYLGVDLDKVKPIVRDIMVDLRFRGDLPPAMRPVIEDALKSDDPEKLLAVMSDRSKWPNVPKDRFDRRVAAIKASLGK